MKRREFIALIGSAIGLSPWAARAQQFNKVPVIGFLAGNATVWRPWTAAFVTRLGELGWKDGQTVKIDYGWWEGNLDHAAEIAEGFVREKVDVIVVNADAVPPVKKATKSIPIVFVLSQDPVGSGLVTNLAHPEGNSTISVGVFFGAPQRPADDQPFFMKTRSGIATLACPLLARKRKSPKWLATSDLCHNQT